MTNTPKMRTIRALLLQLICIYREEEEKHPVAKSGEDLSLKSQEQIRIRIFQKAISLRYPRVDLSL